MSEKTGREEKKKKRTEQAVQPRISQETESQRAAPDEGKSRKRTNFGGAI